MSKECKECTYLKECPDIVEPNSIYCKCHKRIPKSRTMSYEELQQKVIQLEVNRDVVFTKEEVEKLLKQLQEIDECDTALTSSLMSKKTLFENEILKKKINQLETNRDEALNLMEKCKFDKTDKYIAISEYKEYQELKAILERGKE